VIGERTLRHYFSGDRCPLRESGDAADQLQRVELAAAARYCLPTRLR
jgi:hypothetical protein